MRYCIFCGVEIPGDAMFCQICGKKQPEESAKASAEVIENEEREEEAAPTGIAGLLSSPKKLLMVGLGIFVVLILIVTLVIVLTLKK